MANPFAAMTTLNAVGVSAPIALDPTARVTAILLGLSNLTASSAASGAADVTVQGTFESWTPSGLAPTTWNNLSTSHYSSASGAQLITWTGPLAGLRLSSSTWSGAAVVTLKALQAVTAGP